MELDPNKGLTVIIAGSRTIMDVKAVQEAIQEARAKWATKGYWIKNVYSGAASGPDTIGATLARAAGLEVTFFPPQWNTIGRAAGMKRNQDMLDKGANALIAVWDGTSRGTNGMITMATAKFRDPFFIHIHNAVGNYVNTQA